MKPEIEVRFPNIDPQVLRMKLRELGATCAEPMHEMRRAIIDYPDRRLQIGQKAAWGFVRVRAEGEKTVVTYKCVARNERMDNFEIEFEVSSFEKAVELFEAIGLQKHGEQHTRRELWKLGGCAVTIDEWPWLEPMVEIEGPNETVVHGVAVKLGFDLKDAVKGNAQDVYMKKYPGIGEHESISQIPLLAFEGEMPEWLKDRKVKK